MHPNPSFRKVPQEQNLKMARARGFGTLAVNGPDGPLISHIPFIVSDDGALVEFHIVRSNPIALLLKQPCAAVIAITDCDGYISPDWYGEENLVPTWNYVAVHLRGRAELAPQDSLRDLLVRQSAAYENRLDSKPPWTMDKLSPEDSVRMQRMILPVRLHIDSIDGTWKLGQNKGDAARQNAASLVTTGLGQGLKQLAHLMKDPPA